MERERETRIAEDSEGREEKGKERRGERTVGEERD